MKKPIATDGALLALAGALAFDFAAGDRRRLRAARYYLDQAQKQLQPIADRHPRGDESIVRYAREQIDAARRAIDDMRDQKKPKPTAARNDAIADLVGIFVDANPDATRDQLIQFVSRELRRLDVELPKTGGDAHSLNPIGRLIARARKRAQLARVSRR